MLQYKVDILNSIENNVKAILNEDPILYTFDIIPLDYNVVSLKSPKLFISLNKFIFAYDERIEIHELNELEFEILGDEPKFKFIQQLTEGKYVYDETDRYSYKKLKGDDTYTRLNYFEQGQIPKNIAFRINTVSGKPFQTWAMAQIILNIKNRLPKDPILEEMLIGSFAHFNTITIVLFMVTLISYFALHFIISSTINGVISSILDFIFGGILIAMGAWTYLSLEKNNANFFKTYLKYKPNFNLQQNQNSAITQETPVISEIQSTNPVKKF